jgi:hypothetical protein
MLVTVLHRLSGGRATEGGSAFSDVDESAYYAKAIAWAETNGLVSGVGNGLFAPDAAILRQDLAALIMRYANFAAKQFPMTLQYAPFADEAEIADYAKNAVQTLYNGGIISGKPGNVFDPRDSATRAEVAAILHRFINKI